MGGGFEIIFFTHVIFSYLLINGYTQSAWQALPFHSKYRRAYRVYRLFQSPRVQFFVSIHPHENQSMIGRSM